MDCPKCEYQSDSEHGMKIHYGKSHDGTLSGIVIDCDNCGDTFRTDEYRLERSENLFCSPDCHDNWRAKNVNGEDAGGWDGGKVEFTCSWCGESSKKWNSRIEKVERNFCSDKCLSEWRSEFQRGENSDSNWRKQKKWLETAQLIKERDQFSCNMCGSNDSLEVHHITPTSVGGDKYDPYNLVTLCESCHRTGDKAVHSSPHYKNYRTNETSV